LSEISTSIDTNIPAQNTSSLSPEFPNITFRRALRSLSLLQDIKMAAPPVQKVGPRVEASHETMEYLGFVCERKGGVFYM